MRFRTLKIVTAVIVVVVLLVCVCVALVRKFVFPAPSEKQHASVYLRPTKMAAVGFKSFNLENHTSIRLVIRTIEIGEEGE